MRRTLLILAASATMLFATAAMAAPTCEDRSGGPVRCGAPGAMPVGWALSPDARVEPPGPDPAVLPLDELFSLICVVGGLFALIALMPAFDGWDKEESDDERRR